MEESTLDTIGNLNKPLKSEKRLDLDECRILTIVNICSKHNARQLNRHSTDLKEKFDFKYKKSQEPTRVSSTCIQGPKMILARLELATFAFLERNSYWMQAYNIRTTR